MKDQASILVVDDSALHRKQMAALLQRHGYDVKLATTANEALALLLKEHFFLAIASAKLAKMQAFSLAKQMKQAPRLKDLPLILVLPRPASSPKVQSFLDSYVDETLIQPIQVGPFLQMVKRFDKHESEPPSPPPQPVRIVTPPRLVVESPELEDPGEILAELTEEAHRQLAPVLPRRPRTLATEPPPEKGGGYLSFYGFRIKPFSNTPDDRFYYSSAEHSRALLRLSYVVENMEGLGVLIGNVGAGKTTLARRLLATLDQDEYEAALMVIVHSAVTPDWLLHRISVELGVRDAPEDKLQLIGQLYRRLVEIYRQGKKAVILIDEAQMLATRELMEELRGLLNLEVPGRKLLTFVLFGLSSLDEVLDLDEPLRQRVVVRYQLNSFDRDTVAHYVQHRMRVAGLEKNVFDAEAIDVIYANSRGIPRLINTICNNCLLEGYLQGVARISREIVVSVCNSLLLDKDEDEL